MVPIAAKWHFAQKCRTLLLMFAQVKLLQQAVCGHYSIRLLDCCLVPIFAYFASVALVSSYSEDFSSYFQRVIWNLIRDQLRKRFMQMLEIHVANDMSRHGDAHNTQLVS